MNKNMTTFVYLCTFEMLQLSYFSSFPTFREQTERVLILRFSFRFSIQKSYRQCIYLDLFISKNKQIYVLQYFVNILVPSYSDVIRLCVSKL